MWLEVKITLCNKLLAELIKQVEEIKDILTQDQRRLVRL